ncbi:hypothetical protein VDG1235_4867 [Verrucomicrobiia bacterium DG1235]|nr:hypothetical protein VDG1235_4867 [Verrucomicrobiae bacterium DG1235]
MPRLGLSEVGEAEGLPRGGGTRSKLFSLLRRKSEANRKR